MKCPVCSAEIPSTAKFCGGCGASITSQSPAREEASIAQVPAAIDPSYSSSSRRAVALAVEKKYKTLRMIALLYKVLAFLAGALCVIAALFVFIAGAAGTAAGPAATADPTAMFGGAATGLFLLLYGAFLFIFLYGLGEWMYVFMDIEENTRKTNEMLARQ